jgi:hypothetical protein
VPVLEMDRIGKAFGIENVNNFSMILKKKKNFKLPIFILFPLILL